ncbi:MAG: efflux RND transporter permease subunit [Candidatus Sericytochromatia bacterium]|nr:efflux RND transporter permease subunit [Candidatus Sericytochromatia bacterium]
MQEQAKTGANVSEESSGFNFSTFFIRNPVTTVILMLMLVIGGMASFFKMPLELFPNIEFPVVVVNTVYPGAAPTEVETLVTKPIEDAVGGINGLDTLSSQSKDGLSTVIVTLKLGTSSKEAASDIRDKISAIQYKLPKDAKPPSFSTFSFSSTPIVSYAVSAPMSDIALSTWVKDTLKPRLEQVPGVAQILLSGNVEPAVEVALEPERLQAHGLSLPGVFQTIQSENYNLPGGIVEGTPRQYNVRTMGKYDDVGALGGMVMTTPGGATVRLRDLGTVRQATKDRTTYAAVDGAQAVIVSVTKQTDANAVEMVTALDSKMAALKDSLPRGLTITKAQDTTKFVKQSNAAVWEHLAIGAVLAVMVLYVFLRNVPAMLISGLAIPLSIIAAFIPMYLMGFTFNNLTTLALSLVVGILVDDAVVDLENIYRHLEMGEEPIRAAINATGEIQLAVTATTMTIIGVFLPMSFMSGFIGRFFQSFGLTVTFAVAFSLLIARTLTPMMSAYLLKVEPKAHGAAGEPLEGRMERSYGRLLRWGLEHRGVVIVLAIVTFFGGLNLTNFIQKSFLTNADRGEFLLRVQLPKGSPLEETRRIADGVATKVKAHPEVAHVLTTIGNYGSVDDARLSVLMVPKDERAISDAQLAKLVREEFAGVAGYKVLADEFSLVPGNNKPVDVQLQGDSLEELRAYSAKLVSLMAGNPMFADLESSLGDEKPEIRLVPDRERMAQYGVSASQLALTLRLATTGETPSTITFGPNEVDVWVRLADRYRQDLDGLRNMTVLTPRGPVPLSTLAEVTFAGGFSQIEHKNRQRLVHVTANLVPGTTVGTATDFIKKELLPKLDLPPSVVADMDGQAKQQADSFSGFGQAMLMGIVLIYFILALQFGSFLHPLTIMMSLPLSIIGAFLGLLLFGKDLGMMALIGIIMLMGIVTKNAILIIDFTLTMRERGVVRFEAVIEAAKVRLRPILMTTAAMVLGMLPMALGIGAGSEFRSPMAVVVIGGLVTSTFLTLLVVPVFYTLLDDMKGGMGRIMRRGRRPESTVEPQAQIPVPGHALSSEVRGV